MRIHEKLPDDLSDERVLNERQSADLFNVSVSTFRREYAKGRLPKAVQLSARRHGWRVKDLLAHLAREAAR